MTQALYNYCAKVLGTKSKVRMLSKIIPGIVFMYQLTSGMYNGQVSKHLKCLKVLHSTVHTVNMCLDSNKLQ